MTIQIGELTSHARWNVHAFWRRGREAIARPSGRGWAVREIEPGADLTALAADGWRLVVDAEEDYDYAPAFDGSYDGWREEV